MPHKDPIAKRIYNTEYMRKKRALMPPKRKGHPPNTMADFWSHVNKGPNCWEWQVGVTNKGYAKFKLNGKTWLGHRLVWKETYGDPGDLHVLHSCDNPPCVRPSHLFLGTHNDNMADMTAKNRQAKGLQQGNAKLSDEQAQEMVDRYIQGNVKQIELAAIYGISQSQVSHIIIGRKRKSLARTDYKRKRIT